MPPAAVARIGQRFELGHEGRNGFAARDRLGRRRKDPSTN
jgi:hypothetical protein